MRHDYFKKFEDVQPPSFSPMSAGRMALWHGMAGLTVGLGAWYLLWRWTHSLNPDAIVFSITVATVETLFFLGTLLFYYDIWREADTARQAAPGTRAQAGLDDPEGVIHVDVFLTTYDENEVVVEPSVEAALRLRVPENVQIKVHLLDDGNRPEFARMAQRHGINYISRGDNLGFKAGNLRNALFTTDGDFVAILDADTRVYPSFVENTLGYFRDPQVAWVQTPHWFYDVPQGQSWASWLQAGFGRSARRLAPVLSWLTGQERVGKDPFLSDPTLFFDVIQRRRNRHGASFCCGAGSIHRREAVFRGALGRKGQDLKLLGDKLGCQAPAQAIELQPFRFHVSEDIYTSILLQSDPDAGWISVYHPQVECRMLSPWSLEAWATQRLKYAGGTFDIMLHDNPLYGRGMPWRTKLHYVATFWSYLTALWAPVLLLAPAISLVTGWAPVKAYSMEFFAHFLPALIAGELAMIAGCKGHNINAGRLSALATLPIQLRALSQVLRGRKPQFPTTPKTPILSDGLRFVAPNLTLLVLMICAAVYGVIATYLDFEGHSVSLLVVNLFWLSWNGLAVGRFVLTALWRPQSELGAKEQIQTHTRDQADGITGEIV